MSSISTKRTATDRIVEQCKEIDKIRKMESKVENLFMYPWFEVH